MHDVIRVVVADDQALVRGGFRALIDSEPDMQVVGEATRGDEAVRIALDLLPDVVLMDIRMPDLDGLQATQRIVSDPRATSVHVVVVTTFELDEYVTEAIRAGASGFLVKDTEPADLIRAVRVVAGGDALLSPTVTRRLLERVAEATRSVPTHPGLAELTSREREVFIEVACGYSNEEIAGRLFLSESTVKTHVSHVMGKLGARDRAQVVVAAYEAGVIRPGWVEPGPGSLPRT
jgi:DNA-binding NarL/FixJ family response regulator